MAVGLRGIFSFLLIPLCFISAKLNSQNELKKSGPPLARQVHSAPAFQRASAGFTHAAALAAGDATGEGDWLSLDLLAIHTIPAEPSGSNSKLMLYQPTDVVKCSKRNWDWFCRTILLGPSQLQLACI